MNWTHITSAFILGTIGVIFSYDTIADIFGSHATISEQITNWIDASKTNLVIFLSLCCVLCVHFIWGYYKNN
jgi:uncharacterized membrane protein YuzA (DUF378 family)